MTIRYGTFRIWKLRTLELNRIKAIRASPPPEIRLGAHPLPNFPNHRCMTSHYIIIFSMGNQCPLRKRGYCVESGDVAPIHQRHRGSRSRVPSAGRILRFFNKDYVLLGIFGLKYLIFRSPCIGFLKANFPSFFSKWEVLQLIEYSGF